MKAEQAITREESSTAVAAPHAFEAISAVSLVLQEGFRFTVDFGLPDNSTLSTDVKPPLGKGAGPDSEQLLVSAVANCLSSSLLFSLRKFKNEGISMHTTARATLARNHQSRLRVSGIEVAIHLGVPASSLRQLDRALAQFEDFCVVTQSVRAAIPVGVRVFDHNGTLLTGP
jgi:organic hydroperoxide reductase OsmC/OhrA